MKSASTVFACYVLGALVTLWTASNASAADWPCFRGLGGHASAPDANIPVQWSEQNIRWKLPIEGVGISSPVVSGDHVFYTSAEPDGSERRIFAVDRKKGNVLWKHVVKMDGHKKHDKNSYATSTPVIDGQFVYASFTAPDKFMVYCLDFAGKLQWEKNVGIYTAEHGSGASLMMWKDRVIVANDQDGPSFVAALDAKTGETVWKTPREAERTSYSTPLIYSGSDGDQIIVSSMDGITSFDPWTGKLRWVCDRFEKRTVGTPMVADGLIVAGCGQGSRGELMVAVRPDGASDVSATHVAWETGKVMPYCPTPLSVGKHLFLITDTGIARCLTAKTGEEVWTERLSGKFAASPELVGKNVLFVSEGGDVYFVAAEDKYKLIAKNKLDDFFLSTAAILDDCIILRGEKFLWCVGQ